MKKLLLTLLISLFSFIGFGYCLDSYVYNISQSNFNTVNNELYGQESFVCLSISDLKSLNAKYVYYRRIYDMNGDLFNFAFGQWDLSQSDGMICGHLPYGSTEFYSNIGLDVWGITYKLYQFAEELPEPPEPCEICEDCSTWQDMYNQCQSSYNTLSGNYSTCSSNYSSCVSDLGLCGNSLSSCSSDLSACLSGNVGTGEYNRSALFINNIQHLGKPIINITIPEEIDWDYTGNENSFDLTVKGYAVDSDYIQGIIDINSYQVTSEDFTDIFVNGLTLIFPYIIVVLFIVFIRKLVKKIFS